MHAIEFRGVTKKFGAAAVIEDLSFSLDGGRILWISGRSGSGKTTLLRLIAGLELPDSGSILLNDVVVTDCGVVAVQPDGGFHSEDQPQGHKDTKKTHDQYKNHLDNPAATIVSNNTDKPYGYSFVTSCLGGRYSWFRNDPGERISAAYVPPAERGLGMVFQDFALWPHMSVARHLDFVLKAKGIARDERKARIRDLLTLCGLLDRARGRPSELSGGEQQRLAIARAMVAEPRILLLDEPLSNLDAALKGRILAEILRRKREHGLTVVMATHDDDEIRSEADQVLRMK